MQVKDKKMKTFLCFLVVGFYLTQCEKRENCAYWNDGYGDIRCLVDRPGYALFTCRHLVNITGIQDDADKYVWVERGGRKLCSKPFDGCRCYEHNYATWYDKNCECYDPTPSPEFPLFGAISWNGIKKEEYIWHEDSKTEFSMKGIACKSKNGVYLKKERKMIDGVVRNAFELIIPNEDMKTYIKYSGFDSNMLCRKQILEKKEVDEEESLSNIWNYRHRFAKTSEVNLKSNLREQTWKFNNDGEDHNNRFTWIVHYDNEKKVAVPKSYRYYYFDEIEDQRTEITLSYSFKEYHQDCRNTNPSYYCNNI